MQYRCLGNIHADGVRYKYGQLAEFSGQQANELLAGGVIEPMPKPFSRRDGAVKATLQREGR